MVTISLEVSPELAKRLSKVQDRLPEIIELGLRQLEQENFEAIKEAQLVPKQQILKTLHSTGIVTLPKPKNRAKPRERYTPIKAGGPPASEMIIKERRDQA